MRVENESQSEIQSQSRREIVMTAEHGDSQYWTLSYTIIG